MQRVSVVGNSGSGKSTLARRLAVILGATHLEQSIISWAWSNHAKYHDRYAAAAADPAYAHLTFVRLTSRRAITRFLVESAAGPATDPVDVP